jgi:hypothetical protein
VIIQGSSQSKMCIMPLPQNFGNLKLVLEEKTVELGLSTKDQIICMACG